MNNCTAVGVVRELLSVTTGCSEEAPLAVGILSTVELEAMLPSWHVVIVKVFVSQEVSLLVTTGITVVIVRVIVLMIFEVGLT